LQVYLATAPKYYREASSYHHRIAHAAYRIGIDSRLLRQAMPMSTKGGILVLSDRGAAPILRPEQLCRDILQECFQRNFHSVLADFEERATPDRVTFLQRLQATLQKNSRTLFLPEAIAKHLGGIAVINTALSGGNLKERMQEAAEQFGRERVALDLERLIMSFPLPCPDGKGAPLRREQLDELMRTHAPLSFYSPDLAAKYFTYAKNGTYRFVLYDDTQTIREKIRLGHSLGFSTAFLMYPETEDLLPQLFGA